MSRIVHAIYGREDKEFETAERFIQEKLVSGHKEEDAIIVARYGTNKTELKKILASARCGIADIQGVKKTAKKRHV